MAALLRCGFLKSVVDSTEDRATRPLLGAEPHIDFSLPLIMFFISWVGIGTPDSRRLGPAEAGPIISVRDFFICVGKEKRFA